MRTLLFLLFSIGTFACSNRTEQAGGVPVASFQLKDNSCVNLSEFVSSVELVPLETTEACLIGTLAQLVEHNGYYYIGSAGMVTEKVMVFNADGRFLYKLDKRGMGPDEYITIADFAVMGDFRLVVVTRSDPRLLVYDLAKDSCLFRKRLDIYPTNVLYKDDCFYVVKSGTPYQRDDAYLIYQYNREGEMTGRLFEGDEAAHSAISFISSAGDLSVYRDELYFTYHFCDTLYRFTDGHFTPFLLVDVGDKFIPPDKVKGVKELKELEAIIKQEKGWYGGILSYYLDDPVSVFTFLDYQYIGYLSLYNRSTGQTLTATHLYDDLLFKGHRFRLKAWKLPKLYKDGVLYYVADPSDLMEAMEDYKRRISAEAWEAFCREQPEIVDQIRCMKEDDNPVLVKLMVKL